MTVIRATKKGMFTSPTAPVAVPTEPLHSLHLSITGPAIALGCPVGPFPGPVRLSDSPG